MQTKLGQLLLSLSPQEWRDLSRFLKSSFLNPRPEVVDLLAYLKEAMGPDHFPDRSTIAQALYPDESVSDDQIRRLMSYLVKGIEKYFVWQEMTADPMTVDLHLLKAYRRRHLAKGFQATAARMEKKFEAQGWGNENDHLNRYSFHLERYNFTVNRAGKEPARLNGILEELDHFYLVSKLKQACNALNHQRLFKIGYDIPLLEVLLQHIQEHQLESVPGIGIYYQSYLTLAHESETHFFALKSAMDAHIQLFDSEDQLGIFMLAINYCIRQLNKGKEKFLREVFELYQKALLAGILLENGQLSHWTYKNIVSAGLKLKEFTWTAEFLEAYHHQLAEKHRNSSYAFNKAKYFFARGEYRDALRLLRPTSFHDLFLQLDARVLDIKCHYELDELDRVEYQLDNFRQLLRRKELLAYHREHYRNFIDLTWALVRGSDPEKLRARIVEGEVLAEKQWLLQQLNPA